MKNTHINKPKPKKRIKLLKKIKKDNGKSHQKILKSNLDKKPINIGDNKKGKNLNQKPEQKNIYTEIIGLFPLGPILYTEINKYIFQGNEYFDLKEVLTFLYDKLKINLDSPNNKIKDKEEFKAKMNEILSKLFVIYFNKILITEENLNIFLEYLSQYIKLEPKEIIKLLKVKNFTHKNTC